MILNSIDDIQDYDGLSVPVAVTSSGNDSSVDIILEVPFRRVLDATVLAYDCKEHPLTDAIELGKIICGMLYVNGVYFRGGARMCFCPLL